jgi:hypothetical protein
MAKDGNKGKKENTMKDTTKEGEGKKEKQLRT